MAEVIPLATFELDTTRLNESLSSSQDRYLQLKKEQQDTAKKSKDVQKQIETLTKAQEALTNAAGDNTEAIAKNEREIRDLIQAEKALAKETLNRSAQLTAARREITQTTVQLQAYQNAEGETVSLIELANEALQAEIRNKNDATASNQRLSRIVNQLNPAIEEEAELIVTLNRQMDANNDFIRENSNQLQQQKINIGNYTESIIDAYHELEEEKKALEEVREELIATIGTTEEGTDAYRIYVQQLNVLNVQINNVTESMEEARGETGGLAEDFNALGGPIGSFISQANQAGGASNLFAATFTTLRTGILGALQAGLAFIATPIGAAIAALAVAVGLVVGAFKLAKASLESTEEGSQRLAVVTGTVTGIFKGLFNVIKPLGLFLADVFIKHLENVGKAAQAMAGFIADALDFVGFDETAKSVRNFTNEIVKSSAAAAKLAKAEGELAVQQRQAQRIQLEYQKQAEKIRQQRDDESNSIAKRIALNNQLGEVLQKQSESELAIANKQLEVANLRIKAEGQTTEALNTREEALANISDIQERITGQESEQLANLNSLRKEAADAEKERQEKATERALALSKARIDLFIAEQGFKRKSAEEEYQFNYELYNKEYADLKLQLQKKKITQQEFDAQSIQLRNDYLAKNATLTIENAQLELDETIAKNQRILDSDKFLSESQLALKKQALADDLKAQQEFEKLRLEQGEINQKEYNANINAINEENRVANLDLEAQRKEEEEAKRLIDLENLSAINEEDFLLKAEIEKSRNDILRQQEIDNAEQTGADISLINAKYAEANKKIEKSVTDFKLQQAASIFGDIASILGENSKAGKAAAIAQATINTYQGATAVLAAPSVLPEPFGTIQKIVSAGVVVATGLVNVKKIVGTKTPTVSKTPSYASGVIGLRGAGFGTSDSISANLSAGESVINARSTSMFANELAAINQAGGGVGLNGTSNVLTQNTIEQNANNAQMAQMIAEAVAIGAEAGTSKGSEKGLTNLSDNRRVMNNAKF